ncbi:MAG: PhaM family polyhydroxyalkanoate granule multifunctional regulatory protein [Rhodoferax sp.]|nr:PhaM family polyhydroxyalkanoate granule multifunctional regulatory protein [Rhodoferax sp.]
MSDADKMGFGKFVPGFDFLQNLAKGAGNNIPQMPNLANWVAPTLNMEELDKRIEELKGVHFWLEQNSRALGATIQALEVQKMTLATLTGMNFNLGDMANALKLKAADSVASSVQRVTEKATSTAKTISSVASSQQGRRQGRGQSGRCARRAGGPDATVGRANPTVPNHCGHRHERSQYQNGCRHDAPHGHRFGQGGVEIGLGGRSQSGGQTARSAQNTH